MTTLDSSDANSSDSADDAKVKKLYQESIGFKEVNFATSYIIIGWVASKLRSLIAKMEHFYNLTLVR